MKLITEEVSQVEFITEGKGANKKFGIRRDENFTIEFKVLAKEHKKGTAMSYKKHGYGFEWIFEPHEKEEGKL